MTVPQTIALTFDDGPDPLWTPRPLAALQARREGPFDTVVCAEILYHLLDRGRG